MTRKNKSDQSRKNWAAIVAGAVAAVASASTLYAANNPYTGGTAGTSSTWLTNTNWTGNTFPTSADNAQFGALPGITSGIGINFNSTTNNGTQNEIVGSLELTSANTIGILIGNSSTTAGKNGTLTLQGTTVNSVSDVIIRNNSAANLTIQNTQGSGTLLMAVALNDATNNKVMIDGAGNVIISSIIKNGTGNALTLGGAGSGQLVLSGANTYSGGTTINAATLSVGNASGLGTGSVTVAGGTLLTTVANVTIGGGASMSSGNLTLVSGGIGTLTLGSNQAFNMTGGNWTVTLGATNTCDAIIGSGATSSFNVANATISLDGAITAGSYHILSGFNSGSVSNLTIQGYNTLGYSASLNQTTGYLTVTQIGTSLTWQGAVSDGSGHFNWDHSTGNFTGKPGGMFADGDFVTFDNTASNFTVNVTDTVAPTIVTFANTSAHAYTLAGTGKITGFATINVSGGGTAVISTTNDFTGPVTVSNASTLSIGSNGALGATSGLTLNNGILQAFAPVSTNAHIILAAGNGTFDTNGVASSLTGAIAGSGTLTVIGTGSVTLNNTTNSYSGTTTINTGATLAVAGGDQSLSNASVNFAGGTLKTAVALTSTSRPLVVNTGGGTFNTNGLASSAGNLTVNTGNTFTVNGGGKLTLAGTVNIYGDISLPSDTTMNLNGSTYTSVYSNVTQINGILMISNTFDLEFTANASLSGSGKIYIPNGWNSSTNASGITVYNASSPVAGIVNLPIYLNSGSASFAAANVSLAAISTTGTNTFVPSAVSANPFAFSIGSYQAGSSIEVTAPIHGSSDLIFGNAAKTGNGFGNIKLDVA